MSDIRSDSVYSGDHADNEHGYRMCARCRFVCDQDRDISANEGSKLGWGIAYVSTGTANVTNPVVTSGCPQCGTFLYNK